ncbi:hypothetical protein HDU91_006496, partial [Kappamyces sp. JEL0680]
MLLVCQAVPIVMNAISIYVLAVDAPLMTPPCFALGIGACLTALFFAMISVSVLDFFALLDERITKQRLWKMQVALCCLFLLNGPIISTVFSRSDPDPVYFKVSLSLMGGFLTCCILVAISCKVFIHRLLLNRLTEAIQYRFQRHQRLTTIMELTKLASIGFLVATIITGNVVF